MKNILILGATSAIAEATAKLWAAEGHAFYLAARNTERLQLIQDDLMVRGAKSIVCTSLDFNDFSQHEQFINAAFTAFKRIDIVLIAHGSLGNQQACEQQFEIARVELNTNCMSVMSLLTYLSNHMQTQGQGTIAVIGSVAADRARASNYVYATAKVALETFCIGLRARLRQHGVQVLVIKPGFIATPMTAHLHCPKLVTGQVGQVAKDIKQAVNKGKQTLYTPWFWFWIMAVVKRLPMRVYQYILNRD